MALAAAATIGLSAPGAAAKAKPKTVQVVRIPGVGVVLADNRGHTLYTLTNSGKEVDCSGD
jgi:hypothetical protein